MWVEWIIVAVLLSLLAASISTIRSIVLPVRRMVEATRRRSAGGSAHASRGGIKELDVLAAAFNEMADELAVARNFAALQHAKLEERVQERTLALQCLVEPDPLNQLPNRRHLSERLNIAIASPATTGNRVGVHFIDLDNLKTANDGMGHGFGDRVLQSVARRLADATGNFGIAAQLSGDEFTVVYVGAASSVAIVETGETLCRAFHEPLTVDERQGQMGVSLGVSVYPDHETDADALLRAADAALLQAKASGRSRLSVSSRDLLEAAVNKFSIEQGLRRAVERGQFELVFQPEVCLGSLEPTLVEALLRWRTLDGRQLASGEFLGVAEESGLIIDVSRWVLRTAIATARRRT